MLKKLLKLILVKIKSLLRQLFKLLIRLKNKIHDYINDVKRERLLGSEPIWQQSLKVQSFHFSNKVYEKMPVLLTLFNRPFTTERVFEAIKNYEPNKLFISADGPRDIEGEKNLCQKARLITERVDWDCKVQRLYHSKNLGCCDAMTTAISWFFDNVDYGIILEDDCVPDISFFKFCKKNLLHYQNDTRIMAILGTNFQPKSESNSSYYFSKLVRFWGWASWKRAWNLYDYEMTNLSEFISSSQLNNIIDRKLFEALWTNYLTRTKAGEIDSWGYRWAYSIFKNNALVIKPNKNLVKNIGFGENATHTFFAKPKLQKTFSKSIQSTMEINHPDFVLPSQQADLYSLYNLYSTPKSLEV